MSTGRVARATAVLLASLTAVFGAALAGPAATAQTLSDDDAAPVAAGWLAGQLVDGNHFETVFGDQTFPDQGLTADAVLAFDAADVAQDRAEAATAWLAGPDIGSGYVGDGTTASYPGALAKLALVAMAQGRDPGAFGGIDLIERLKAREGTIEPGRFSDLSEFGDFTNGITQSLAIIALLRDDENADVQAPVDFLAASRCDDGGFPLQFGQPACTSEVDSTAFVIQALLAAGRATEAGDALDYLEDVQGDGGGFGGSGPTSGINANSTGLAAQALQVGGRADAADAAVKYLLGQQIGCDGPAAQRGAIAYDSTGFQASNAVRATAQSVYGLTGVGFVVVDNTGDAADAPALHCTPPSTPSDPTSEPPPAQGSGAGAGDLPATGVRPLSAAGLGVLLVLAGVGALLLSRSRPIRPKSTYGA